MNKSTDIEGRNPFSKKNNFPTRPLQGTTLLFLIPAFLYLSSCTALPGPSPTKAPSAVQTSSSQHSTTGSLQTSSLHIFTYNDDPLKRLDACQQYQNPDLSAVKIDSRSGRKLVVLCGNSPKKNYGWQEIQSFRHLSRLRFRLEDDDPAYPLSAGVLQLQAGTGQTAVGEQLNPFLSTIELHTLRVDFTGRSYRGSPLEDIKIYLTNVNAEVSLPDTDFSNPSRYANHRGLDPEGLEAFKHPGMLYQEIEDIPDFHTCWTQVGLYCYPNTCPEENMGSSFTKLVIEGKINGITWYYPIPVGRRLSRVPFASPARFSGKTDPFPGIERNCRYVYDITIKRTGSTHPDIPVDCGAVETRLNIEPWKNKEEYDIIY